MLLFKTSPNSLFADCTGKNLKKLIFNRVIEITGELGHQACNIALYLAAKMR